MKFERMRTRHLIIFVVAVFAIFLWSGRYMRVVVIKVNGNKDEGILNDVKDMSNVRDDDTKQGTHTKINFTKTYSRLTDGNSEQSMRNENTEFLSDSSTKQGNMNYLEIVSMLNTAKVSADNEILVEVLRKHFIQPPSTLPYNLTRPQIKNPSPKQAQVVDRLLNKKVTFFTGELAVGGKIVESSDNITLSPKYIKAQCFPLYSVLLALDMPTVDYFSLDVEGAEQGVLDTLPWDKVDIRILWEGGKPSLTAYMAKKGYSMVTQVKLGVAPDLIFMKI